MVIINLRTIKGITEYIEALDGGKAIYMVKDKAFLIINDNTIEIRTDKRLGKLLKEKYESVMTSRYFGQRGIEIVMSGQIGADEVKDLIRLSYDLTKDEE